LPALRGGFAILPFAGTEFREEPGAILSSGGLNTDSGDNTRMRRVGRRVDAKVWAALAVLLVIYVFSALRVKPLATFGVFTDDALYFSAAKALAAGQGYILPSFPGRLPAFKYPKLYPLLLSAVWRINPDFPANISLAVGLTLAFGCISLIVAFAMLREWPGMNDWMALAVVGTCGLSSFFLYMSACVMSDIPFLALALAAAWLAERSLRGGRGTAPQALLAGLLVGLSVGLRSMGVPVAIGIGLLMLLKRKYRQLIWFCVLGVPLTIFWAWPSVAAVLGIAGTSLHIQNPTQSGWTQTLCFYTSYGCALRMSLGGLRGLAAIIKVNLELIALQPGMYLLDPLTSRGTPVSLMAMTLASALAYAGIFRRWKRTGWRPIHAIFCCYAPIVLVFPANPNRYLLLFLPLFFDGIWTESRHIGSLLADRMRKGQPAAERATGAVLALVSLALCAATLINYSYRVPAELKRLGKLHSRILAAQLGAYAWIRQHAAPDASVLAYEDGLAYLYTGHPSILPIASLPESFFLHDPRFARDDAARLADVAKHVGASYWLTSAYDPNADDPGGFGIVPERQKQILSRSPVVYRSPNGLVTLYDIRCLAGSKQAGCGATAGEVRPTRGVSP